MRIGIDIDGVLNSQHEFVIEYGTRFCKQMGKYKLENVNAMDTEDIFLWGEDVAHKFWDKYRAELAINLPAKERSAEVIGRLKEEGNSIYIITARKNNDEWYPPDLKYRVEEITKNWLDENKIYYDEIIFNVEDKGKFCKNNKIDIMIEDEPKNLRKLVGSTNVFVYDYPYNRGREFADLTRVYSWDDILRKINQLLGEKRARSIKIKKKL